MIQLAAKFAPAADEVWRLQNDDDPECRWFRNAVRGKPDAIRGSMQGTYVLTASGRSLGRLNSNNADAVIAMLERSLTAWHELSPVVRGQATDVAFAPVHRWEQSYPEAGLVIERFARDRGDDPAATPKRPVNRDAVWFSSEEARGLLPNDMSVGSTSAVPDAFIQRLARLVLVDNVRGQTLPFTPAEVAGSSLRTEVIKRHGTRIELRLTGATRAVAKGPWLGGDTYWRPKREWPRRITTRIFGTATYDTETLRFMAFELVALGERKGRTTFNGRSREDAKVSYKIGFLLRLAPAHWRVAPTFINVYDTDWVVHPPITAK
ncbi:MAG TPA: hypothetical protein EYP98_12870 [Planctomycetes bacterium]|nr:hypothetical protein [Planctomycetota bacterium]